MSLINKIKYYRDIYKKFGLQSSVFLIESKFLKDRLRNRKITGLNHPVQLCNYETDVTTLFQIFFAKEYEMRGKVIPDFIIDCGANIGLSAVYFAARYPKATIVAVEPDKKNFEFLKQNTRFYSNVTCVNKAVWSHNCYMELFDPGTGNWSIRTYESKEKTEDSIEAISIDWIMEYFSKDKIDILKIDIEGAEKELFSNDYSNWLAKTNIIAIELHDNIDAEISKVFYHAISDRKYKKYDNGENLICDFRSSILEN